MKKTILFSSLIFPVFFNSPMSMLGDACKDVVDFCTSKTVGPIKAHPYISIATASVAGVGLGAYCFRWVRDYIFLQNMAYELLATRKRGRIQTPSAQNFKFYRWRLLSHAGLSWETACDVEANRDTVINALYADLRLTGRSQVIFLRVGAPVIRDDLRPDVITLREISNMMQDELIELDHIVDRCVSLSLKYPYTDYDVLHKFSWTASLSESYVLSELEQCFNLSLTEPGSFEYYVEQMDAMQLAGAVNQWETYLNNKSLNLRERGKMKLYLFATARKVRLKVLKGLVDQQYLQMEQPGMAAIDVPAEVGAYQGVINDILRARAQGLPYVSDEFKALSDGMKAIKTTCEYVWRNPVERQSMTLRNLEMIINAADVALTILQGRPMAAGHRDVVQPTYKNLLNSQVAIIEQYFNALL